MMYKIVRGMVPAIKADKVFIPIRNKGQIKPKSHQDCYSSNIISKYALNNSECYKVPASNTDQHKNSYFVKTTSDWNYLSDQASKYLEIGTCPASQKLLAYM